MNEFTIKTDKNALGKRIDVFLSDDSLDIELPFEVSRSFIQKLIKEEKILVDGKGVKSNFKLKQDMNITIIVEDVVEPDIVPENIPLDIIYEDEDVILINKPKGMVVHPAAGHYSGTLVNALMYHCKDNLSGINGVLRPGIVHRIDMNTTGVIVACKNDKAHQSLSEQLKVHSITRKYVAIVHGNIKEDELTISGTIGRSLSDRKKMAMNVRNGKPATTHVKVLERFGQYTYIECQLETGRTHQIRVHLSSINHPLVGDDVYGRKKEEQCRNIRTGKKRVSKAVYDTRTGGTDEKKDRRSKSRKTKEGRQFLYGKKNSSRCSSGCRSVYRFAKYI